MSITSLLATDRIFTDANISSKKRLLEFIAEKTADELSLSKKAILNKLVERERLGSTGLGQGFAVPHARLNDLTIAHACFIKLNEAINFDAMDHQPVDLFFALFIPEASTEEHLQILSSLAKVFSDRTVSEKIRGCHSADDIIQYITHAENAA